VKKGEEPNIFWTGVTAHWTKTVGMKLLQGRDLTEGEAADSSAVAIINQTFASRIFPNESALGRRFRFANDTAAPWITIIGIAGDISVGNINRKMQPQAYLPFRYLVPRNTGLTIRVASGNPAAIMSAVRREIRASDAKVPVFEVATMEDTRALGYWQYKLFGWMFSIFGAIALLLAAIGVYGVISYGVSQRTQEIGVRVALGAGRRDVLRLIIGQGVTLAGLGVGIGIVMALGVTRVVRSQLFNVSPSDPISFGLVAFFLTAIAIAASYVPARKATAVDPIIALKYE
jgi:putative ABC transport system permease protein